MEGLASGNGGPHPVPQYAVHPASHEQSMSAMDLSSELSSVPAAANSVPPWASEDFWQKYLARFGPADKCLGAGQCEMLFKEHYHCLAEGCEMLFRYVIGYSVCVCVCRSLQSSLLEEQLLFSVIS